MYDTLICNDILKIQKVIDPMRIIHSHICSHNLPIIHFSNTPTLFQSYILPILNSSNLFQFYSLPILHPSNLTLFQCLHSSNLTLFKSFTLTLIFQSYTLPNSHSSHPTPFQSCTLPIPDSYNLKTITLLNSLILTISQIRYLQITHNLDTH